MGRRIQRNIQLKSGVFVVGEGITEQYYFTHLKQINKYKCIVKPRFFGKTDISQIEKTVKKLLMGDVTVICVFDADISKRNKEENRKLVLFKKCYKNEECVIICDSLPSIEFWFLLHYVKTNKHFINSKSVEQELQKHLKNYNKTQKFLEDSKWVEELSKNIVTAQNNAKSLEIHDGYSYSNVYKAIDKLEGK